MLTETPGSEDDDMKPSKENDRSMMVHARCLGSKLDDISESNRKKQLQTVHKKRESGIKQEGYLNSYSYLTLSNKKNLVV